MESASDTSILIFATVIGAVIGAIVAGVLIFIGSRAPGRNMVLRKLTRKVWMPLIWTLVAAGAWLGFALTPPNNLPYWYDEVSHALLIVAIVLSGWLWFSGLGLLKDTTILRNDQTGRDVRRIQTQVEILTRVAQSVAVILTIVFVLLTFPAARAPLASLLASASLLSVIVGLAAQSSLGNMFAGLQLAFTDAIRVGDNVVVDTETLPGEVEEITLTYVVVRALDGRRLIVPSTEFTTKPFENWSRRDATQNASFKAQFDWSAPVEEIRQEVERLVTTSPLWDKGSWSMQVFGLEGPYLTLMVTVSASNWSDAWALSAEVRENLVTWVKERSPESIPHTRIVDLEGREYPDAPKLNGRVP